MKNKHLSKAVASQSFMNLKESFKLNAMKMELNFEL